MARAPNEGLTMLVKGKFIKDWDKSKMCTAYFTTQKFQVISYDMEKLQDALLWNKPLARTLIEKLKMAVRQQ